MSPDLIFLLTLALRMAITAAFVVSASIITERSGPVIGALVATLPISAGPSYVFLALDHDTAFIAEGALASLPINAATIFLGLTYVVLAQRNSALFSWACAARSGSRFAVVVRMVHWSLVGGLAANAIAFGICIPLLAQFRHVRMPLIARRWYDIPLRASLVAALVATVVTLSGWVGPHHQRLLALFPVVFLQHDADPAPAYWRAGDRSGGRQFRLGPARLRRRDRRATRRRSTVRIRDTRSFWR